MTKNQYKCFKNLLELVIRIRIAYAKGNMDSAAKAYAMIYDEFDKYKAEFGENNQKIWEAYYEAMSFLRDQEVYDITDHIKKSTGYYD